MTPAAGSLNGLRARFALDRPRAGRRFAAWGMVVPLVAGLTVFTVYPFIYLALLSFSDSNLGTPFRGWVGFENFGEAFGEPRFTGSLGRSAAYALLTTAVSMVLGFAVALLMDRAVRGRALMRTLILLPLMTPPVTVGVIWQLLLMPKGGWLNGFLNWLGVIGEPVSFLGSPSFAFPFVCLADVWQWTPFVALMVYAALQTLPGEIYEAARLDGASGWRRVWHITLPMLAPALIAIALLKLIIAFKVFDLVFVLTGGGPGQATTVSSFYIYRVAIQQFDIGLAAAQTLVFAAVVGLITLPFTLAHGRAERRLA
ncbi:MAG: carbohydrate ABC transporter permease [Alphaproteobacteria bacterium]